MLSANPLIRNSSIKLLRVKQEEVYTKHYPQDSSIKLNSSTRKEISEYTIESETKVGLYHKPNGYSASQIILHLSGGACQLFLYISYVLPKGQDWIAFKVVDYCEQTGMSKMTVYKYLDELVTNLLIAKKQNGQIWINPNYIFNGNRVEYFQENCPDCIETIEVVSTPDSRYNTATRLKKKELMKLYSCTSYYDLKQKLGKQQIEMYSKGNLELEDIKLLR